jgi:molybdopterin molybdotransferase
VSEARALISLDEALARLVEGTLPHRIAQTEEVPTFDALARVLAQDVLATVDVPPADNTSMDGYALRVADVPAVGTRLPVSQRIPAGQPPATLAPGTAARIFTGGQVPAGADAVVMQEQCEAIAEAAAGGQGAGPELGGVQLGALPTSGQWIRRRGEDVRAGAVVLQRGQRLTPQALGLAASVGVGRLSVLRRPRVALFSTGDELMMPGQPLRPGAIYNSNRFMLRGLCQAAGCEFTDLGLVPDRLDATRAALRQAAQAHDLIVTSGGVSVGEEDHLRPAVQAEGQLENWQVAIKPGKPLAFGHVRRADGSAALLVGLPGNPVSAFVTWVLAANTVLRALQGMPTALPAGLLLPAGFDWLHPDRRREFLRVRLGSDGTLTLFPNQSSGVLTSSVWADGLADIAPGRIVHPGDRVPFLPLSELMTR